MVLTITKHFLYPLKELRLQRLSCPAIQLLRTIKVKRILSKWFPKDNKSYPIQSLFIREEMPGLFLRSYNVQPHCLKFYVFSKIYGWTVWKPFLQNDLKPLFGFFVNSLEPIFVFTIVYSFENQKNIDQTNSFKIKNKKQE